MFKCTTCGEAKEVSEFHKKTASPKGHSGVCKSCVSGYKKDIYDYDKERNKNLQNKYGISLEEYNQIYADQNGECAICGDHVTNKKSEGGRTATAFVDHDHDTGAVRGLLCHHCNAGLGHFKDDRSSLEAAVRYLERNM